MSHSSVHLSEYDTMVAFFTPQGLAPTSQSETDMATNISPPFSLKYPIGEVSGGLGLATRNVDPYSSRGHYGDSYEFSAGQNSHSDLPANSGAQNDPFRFADGKVSLSDDVQNSKGEANPSAIGAEVNETDPLFPSCSNLPILTAPSPAPALATSSNSHSAELVDPKVSSAAVVSVPSKGGQMKYYLVVAHPIPNPNDFLSSNPTSTHSTTPKAANSSTNLGAGYGGDPKSGPCNASHEANLDEGQAAILQFVQPLLTTSDAKIQPVSRFVSNTPQTSHPEPSVQPSPSFSRMPLHKAPAQPPQDARVQIVPRHGSALNQAPQGVQIYTHPQHSASQKGFPILSSFPVPPLSVAGTQGPQPQPHLKSTNDALAHAAQGTPGTLTVRNKLMVRKLTVINRNMMPGCLKYIFPPAPKSIPQHLFDCTVFVITADPNIAANFMVGWEVLSHLWNITENDFDTASLYTLRNKDPKQQEAILLLMASLDLSDIANMSAFLITVVKQHEKRRHVCIRFLLGLCNDHDTCSSHHPIQTAGWNALRDRCGVTYMDLDYAVLSNLAKRADTERETILSLLTTMSLKSVENMSAFFSTTIRKFDATAKIT